MYSDLTDGKSFPGLLQSQLHILKPCIEIPLFLQRSGVEFEGWAGLSVRDLMCGSSIKSLTFAIKLTL